MAESSFRFSDNLNKDALPEPIQQSPDNLFSPRYWQQADCISGTSGGRNTVWFIDSGQGSWVLRHYYRGGLPGKLLKDQYIYLGKDKTRAFLEFELLEAMHRKQLPVPLPIAARVVRNGFIYRSDILIEKIPDSEDLFGHLKQARVPQQQWQQIGRTIREFHQQGVWHADLNCHNILLTADKVWLIDFDRCCFRTGKTWQARTLLRLKRSLLKESSRMPEFHFHDSDWVELMRGYSSSG